MRPGRAAPGHPRRGALRLGIAATLAPPRFRSSVSAIDRSTRSWMRWSWRPGCPVGLRDLRLLRVDHWGFDRRLHRGELVVHRDQARRVLRVMERLFRLRYPIRRMRLVDHYRADDDRSIAANNTSALNCPPGGRHQPLVRARLRPDDRRQPGAEPFLVHQRLSTLTGGAERSCATWPRAWARSPLPVLCSWVGLLGRVAGGSCPARTRV